MAYTKQTWIAPAGTGLNRYAKGAETSTHIELNLDPANLTNTPTPITVARLNHMEDGIEEANKAIDISISDADGTNTGTAVSVDSKNETLKLPATIKANITGNASTATAPFYQWRKISTDLYRYAAGESPTTTYYWFKVCKITAGMTFDVEILSDYNREYRASYRLSVATYSSGAVYTVALLNLGQTVSTQAKLAVALDADGYLYIQTNAIWESYLYVTLLYRDTYGFSITMDKLGYAQFGTESGFTPVKVITQTGAFRWTTTGGITHSSTPIINTDIVGNITGNLAGIETIRTSSSFSLSTYSDGKQLRIANTHATNTITVTLPSGQTYAGAITSFTLKPYEKIELELFGTIWEEVGNEGIGTITATGSTTADFGRLLCHGQELSRTTYERLFNRIGTSFGVGNGSTTFNLPDCREVALVGAGTNVLNASVITAHNALTTGQFQDDAFQDHVHTEKVTEETSSVAVKGVMSVDSNFTHPPYNSDITTSGATTGRKDTTTHGKQLGVNYQIKF